MDDKKCTFKEFRRLCKNVANTPKYLEKTEFIKDFINKKGDEQTFIIIKMLLPMVNKRIYRLNDIQIIKLFSKIFNHDIKDMLNDLEKGYVADTVKTFFETSKTNIIPINRSILLLEDVDNFLQHLSTLTKENDQINFLNMLAKVCTGNDLKCIILLIKNDLQIKAGIKCVLDSLHPNAYNYFKTSHNLRDIVKYSINDSLSNVKINPMTPVKPMLADVCESLEKAIDKYKDGMYSEVKYDGERVQIHKKDNVYNYFSRNLKPVLTHKIDGFDKLLTDAFPTAKNFILDAELIMIDIESNSFLPFGSLGIHKKASYENSVTCMFIFDCLYYNDNNFMNVPFHKRRQFLRDNIYEIKNKIMLSEIRCIYSISDLQIIMSNIIKKGFEGIMIKGVNDEYKPGKRGWLKIKKDYLENGSMADSADLVVLGSYYGKGSKGGIQSIFLMGCYDSDRMIWKTVTKCSGHDDKTLQQLQEDMELIKISREPDKIPKWLSVNKIYYPDFVVKDPRSAPVWEIVGSGFTKSQYHTADGISIRFPRCQRIRNDKNWISATNLNQLRELYKKSI
ncbi:DNA ligase-like protein [Moosepox virus GoldyGopher14]|nr:DNA ligase-like protein [Moosepox virus GoldyGopher14]